MSVRVDVRDHGFVPGETADAGPALRAALDVVRAIAGPAILHLAPGDYHLWPETSTRRELFVSNTVGVDPRFWTKSLGLLVEDVEELEISASGARLVLHGRQSALTIIDSRGVIVDGLEIDWAVPTVIDVTVADAGTDADGAWRMLTVPECTLFDIDGTDVVWHSEVSPFTGETYWSGRNAFTYSQSYDPQTERVERGTCGLFEDVANIERLDARTMRVTYRSPAAPEDIGIVYQLREEDRDHPGMLLLESTDVTLRDMRIRYLHGFGLVAQNGRDFTLERTVFAAPAGTGRVTAGFADFVQCSGMQGVVSIRDCEFDGPHDDPINIHGTYLAVTQAVQPDVVELAYAHRQSEGFPSFAVGDEVELLERDTLRVVHSATVVSAAGPTGRDSASLAEPMRVGFESALPEAVLAQVAAGQLAIENVTRTPEVSIVGCAFRRVPTRAILVTTRRAVRIRDCRFESITMPCIQIAADADGWWESGRTQDVVIEDCTFRDVMAGVLEVAPRTGADAGAVHDSVIFRSNDVELTSPLLADLHGLRSFRGEGNVLRWSARADDRGAVPTIRTSPGVAVRWEASESSSLRPVVEEHSPAPR